MICTTFTIAYGRIASGGDFLALGKGVHKTPLGWRHVAARWTPGQEDRAEITAMDDGGELPFNAAVDAAIQRHLRAYINLHFSGPTP